MSEASQTYSQQTLWDTPSATSSPAEDSGVSPCAGQDGPTTDQPGREAAPAQVSQRQAKVQGLMTLVTSGLIGRDSSASEDLQSSLENRLMTRLDSAGSTLFRQIWKRRRTPLGRWYLEHTASVRRTSGSGFTSVPTPTSLSENAARGAGMDPIVRKAGGHAVNLQDTVTLASVPTPMAGSPATETYNAAGNTDYSRRIVELAALPTPNSMEGGQPSRSGKRKGELLMGGIAQLASIATPRQEDSQCAGAHRGVADTLHSQANLAAVSAPSARDWKDTSGMSESGVDPDGSTRSRLDQLPRQAQLAGSGPTATGGTGATASTGQLDPAYSRWLMAVPPEWDAFVCTATQSLSRRRRSSSKRIARQGVTD